MLVSSYKNAKLVSLTKNNKYATSHIPRAKCIENKATISFNGYDKRIKDRRDDGIWGSIKWYVHAGDVAKKEVSSEIEKEKYELDKKIAVKQAEIENEKKILEDLKKTNSEILNAKQAEIKALDQAKKNYISLIDNLHKTLQAKDKVLNEILAANKKIKEMINNQKNAILAQIKENKNLQDSIPETKLQNKFKLKEDLDLQSSTIMELHNIEMDDLIRKINDSARTVDPVKKILNVPKPNGFKQIAGYKEQKDLLIDHVGKSIALEQLGKPTEVPNGILLFGPKGTGKSTFAKALAGQLECKLIEIQDTLDARANIKLLREVALQSKENYGKDGIRTILLIKDFDKFAPKGSRITGALKGFMDNLSKEYHCTVFATTTSPETIDDILLRDKRFDVKAAIPPATKENMVEVLKQYSTDVVNKSIDFDSLIEQMMKVQQEGAFSNTRLKAIMSAISQEGLIHSIQKLGADIDKDSLSHFIQQIEYVKRL